MNRTDTGQTEKSRGDDKARVIAAGAVIGALIGVISSYLYTRAAEENGNPEAGAGAVSTGQLLAVLLTLLGLVRQIAELGKPKNDDKSGKD